VLAAPAWERGPGEVRGEEVLAGRHRSEGDAMGRLVGGRAAAGVGLGVVLLLAALAGCAASGGSSAVTTTTGQRDAAAVWRELVRCARREL